LSFPDSLQATPGTLAGYDTADDEKARDALALVSQLQDDFRPRDDLYEKIDNVLYLLNSVEIPEAYRKTTIEVHSPLPSHIVNNVTAALSMNPPSYGFKAVGMGVSAEDNAALRREFLAASWRRQEQEAKARIFRRWIHSLVTKGEAILKTVERRKTAWAGYSGYSKKVRGELDDPKSEYAGLPSSEKDRIYNQRTEEWKQGAAYPIASIDVPPESFYYIKGENGFTFCAEVKEVPYYDAFVRYGASITDKGRVVPEAMGLPLTAAANRMRQLKTSTLRMVEVWDWLECMYILQGPADVKSKKATNGLIVKRIKHGYGNAELRTLRGPYFHAFGVTTSSRDVDKQGLSILFGFLDLFALLNSLMTIQSNAAFSFGFPAFRRVRTNGLGPAELPFGKDAMDRESELEEIVPGTVYPDNVEPINMPHTGLDLDKAIGSVRSMIDLALPSVAMGSISGDESGYAVNQAAHMAKLQWNPLIENAEFALAERASFESWLIEKKIKETVYVDVDAKEFRRAKYRKGSRDKGWISIGPDDLKGLHRYTAKLNPETPSNELIELRKHQMKLDMRIEAPEQAVEAFGNDPADVERAWLLNAIKQDPAIFEQMKQIVFKGLATIDQEALGGVPPPAAAVSQAAPTPQGAMVPGMAMPPFAQNAVQGVGVEPGNQPPGPPAGAPAGMRPPPPNAVSIPGGGP
jgi:hypothetical protein